MPFETFTKRMVPLTKDPYVTIQSRGVMSFNKSAWVLLGEPKAVELLYDADEKMIGVRAVDPAVEHAYPIRSAANETTFMVSGTAFVKYYGIDTSESRRRPVELIDGIVCIDLKNPGTVVTGARSKKNASPASGGSTDPSGTQPDG